MQDAINFYDIDEESEDETGQECHHCGGEINDDGAGCCKLRRMD